MFFFEALTNVLNVLNLGKFFKDTLQTDAHRKEVRASAAALVIAHFQECIEYILDVLEKHTHYQEIGYDPLAIPETQNAKPVSLYPERPGRLIINRIKQLTLEIDEPLAIIAGSERDKIQAIKLELQNDAQKISLWVFNDLVGNDLEQKKAQKHLDGYSGKLQLLLIETRTILEPIVQEK